VWALCENDVPRCRLVANRFVVPERDDASSCMMGTGVSGVLVSTTGELVGVHVRGESTSAVNSKIVVGRGAENRSSKQAIKPSAAESQARDFVLL